MRPRALISTASAARIARPVPSQPRPWICKTCQSHTRQFSSNNPLAKLSEKPFYITTPIFYVNAAPHVGHLYTLVVADVLKRWEQLKGNKAILCTGTDEHGLKVQKASQIAGIEPKLFCDKGAAIFEELAQRAEITNDHFVRTTDEEHKDAVKHAWSLLREKDYIYVAKHEGWYSVTDEAFYPHGSVQPYLEPTTGRKIMTSVETGSEVEWSSEMNYRFRLSTFRDKLLEFYKKNPTWITPEHRMIEVIRSVESGLEDLSISRPSDRLTWGIRVPGDETQTIYVWLDALMNYVTKAGYPWLPGKEGAGGWPADCHVIGKDIVRFHCIYWPAFLMALDLPLPKSILTHGHWTLGGSKMSKSTGNTVDPFHALDRYGSDVMRLFLAFNGSLQDDAKYDNMRINFLYKSWLHGTLGNLTSRIVRGKAWSVSGAVKRAGSLPAEEWEIGPGSRFYNTLSKFRPHIKASFETHNLRYTITQIAEFVRSGNKYFHMSSPWDRILSFGPGEPGEEVDKIVYLGAECLRMTGIVLQPSMPNKAKLLLDQLGVDESRRTFEYCGVGRDLNYGEPMVDVGRGSQGSLFPPLPSSR